MGRLVAALVSCFLIWFGVFGGAQAQDRATLAEVDARLVRVERVLDQSLLELLQQVESLKREIRVLRGELENQVYELGNVRKRNRDLYLDTDQRLIDLERKTEQSLNLLEEGGLGGELTGSLDGAPGEEGDPPVFVDTDGDQLSAEPEAAAAQADNTAATAQNGDGEKAAYTAAYALLTGGQREEAVAAFEAFLQDYPDGAYADNAWYWQGEARYAQRQFEDAIRLFESVVSLFPQSLKVPDARLKIAYALFEQQRFDESRAALASVIADYPGRAAGTLASKRLAEMDAQGL